MGADHDWSIMHHHRSMSECLPRSPGPAAHTDTIPVFRTYFPMQNFPNMLPRRSSGVILPVIVPR